MSDHDPKCPHPKRVQNILTPAICSYCQVIESVREEYR